MSRPASGSVSQRNAQLQPLDRHEKIETIFVAVAGVGTKSTSEWTDDAGKLWLSRIDAPGIGLFSFEHEIRQSHTGLWQSLLNCGQDLLLSVITLVEEQHTLRLAYERTETKYKPFKKSLAGVILMGTPHSISEQESKWQNVAVLPHMASRTSKSQPMDRDDIKRLAQSSLAFDNSGVLCPILSIYEERATKPRSLFSSKRVKLVERDFTVTGSGEERMLGVDANHRNLCNISNNPEIRKFIAAALEDARLSISVESPTSASEVDELDEHAYDLIDSSSNPTTSPENTASATAGSSNLGFEMVAMLSELKIDTPKLPCYYIPVTQNKDFYGRLDVLSKISEAFNGTTASSNDDGSVSRSFALCGPGGVGKTQIVTEYVHRCKQNKAFDAIFWIYADRPTKVIEGLARIAITLDLVAADSNEALDPVITTNLAKEWLSGPARFTNISDDQGKTQPKWLLVLDNVDDFQAVEDIWPIQGPGCILITSRDPLAKDPGVLAEDGCEVEPLTLKESGEMLEQLTRRKGDGQAVGERLGGFPLAIAQMASVIIRNHMTFEGVCRNLG
ncbi:hypothetical protein NX059_002165 [Plenodomus lindquistii]|nr:hypothetical protein NX059_002165 [Plenodomus lindquistii]